MVDSGGGDRSWLATRADLAGSSSAEAGAWVAAGVLQIWAVFVE